MPSVEFPGDSTLLITFREHADRQFGYDRIKLQDGDDNGMGASPNLQDLAHRSYLEHI